MVTTETIVAAYRVLNAAKLTKCEDADKFKVIKAVRALKKVHNDFVDYEQDAREKLKPADFEDVVAKARKWQEEGENTSLTKEERISINQYFAEYDAKVRECVAEEAKKEHDLEFAKLSDDAFAALIGSNDWTVDVCGLLADLLTEV